MRHKLQTHFFLTYFFMAMIVVLLFSIFFFQYTSEILIERETKSLQELNNSFLSRTDAELREAAEIAQADEFITGFAAGYDTMIAEKGASLSGGQKQRLSIARALLKKPDVLIFDDSMSALDLATSAKLQAALREKLGTLTVITIAQRVASVMNADRILVLDGGTIAAEGNHESLMKTSEIYQDIYHSQLKRGEEIE